MAASSVAAERDAARTGRSNAMRRRWWDHWPRATAKPGSSVVERPAARTCRAYCSATAMVGFLAADCGEAYGIRWLGSDFESQREGHSGSLAAGYGEATVFGWLRRGLGLAVKNASS